MARKARDRSETGIYHIMLRGIDKRDIFLDDEDRSKFIEKIIKAKETADFKLYGYCLMDNHVHLLIGESEEVGTSIKRITVGYVQWHNTKHERTGHLFQNRYMSEVVDTESYLINVLRYIHQNPTKAKMTKLPKDYKWSSYQQYLSSYQGNKSWIDVELIKSYFKKQENFEEYMNIESKEEMLEYKPTKKYTDTILKSKIENEFKIKELSEIPKEERDRVIKDIYQHTGVSIRQLARVLGIGKTIVEKALK